MEQFGTGGHPARDQGVTRELDGERKDLVFEEWYRSAFEYTGTAMLVIDSDTTILTANHTLEEITGYAHEESLKRRKWTEVVVPEDLERMLEYHQKRREAPESVPGEYEFRLIDRYGGKRDMLLHVAIIPGTDKSLVSLVDISRLKKTERALRKSEHKYRDLFENATDIIYTIDLEGNFTSANLSALKTYGYNEDDILRTNIRELIDPTYLGFALEKISDKVQQSTQTRYEILTRTRSGEPVWVEVSTRLIRDADRTVGIQGIARDITERKMYEEKLQESMNRFKETADLLPGIICEIDTSLNLLYANELGLSIFGFTSEDFKRGISVLEIVPEDERERFFQDIRNISSGDYGNPKLYELISRDGRKLQMIINSSPIIKNGTVIGIRSSLFDISDRIFAEKQLRESEERFRSVFSFSPIGIALFNPAGRLIDFNDSFRTMLMLTGDTGRKIRLDTLTGLTSQRKKQLEEGTPVVTETRYSIDKDVESTTKSLEWHLSTISSGQNATTMFLAQVQDVTAREEAHEAHLQKERDATARAEARIAGLQRELSEQTSFHNMISRSPAMKQVFDIMPEVALASASVLIIGDSGTGKELIARSLHDLSSRKDNPFIAVNCGALPDTLLESELFGYRPGAFTDAKKDKPGRFALAEGGTLFLDEVGDISQAMQVKLLRVLQERVYEPLGATQPVKTDVRIIAATNKNIPDMVGKGMFREDLYYRINIVTVELPPLRERRCDIPLLCNHFIERFNLRYNKNITGLSDQALELLLAWDFPGNIRELENTIEHAFIFCKDSWIEVDHLPSVLRNRSGKNAQALLEGVKNLEDLERAFLQSQLADCNNDRAQVAQRLGIHKTTLFRKLRQLGIS